MKIITFAVAGLFLFVSSAVAVVVDTSATDVIQRNPDGSIDVKSGTETTNFQRTDTGVDIISDTEGVNATVNILRDSTGKSINVNVNGLNQVTLDSSSKSLVVNLNGDSVSLIRSDGDLTVYNTLVVQERPAVKTVEVGNGNVVVAYRQPAKFLGVIGTNMGATVTVTAQGEVSVDLPWYSFLFRKKGTSEIKTNIETRLGDSSSGVRLSLLGEGSNASVRVQTGARVVNIVTGTIQVEVDED